VAELDITRIFRVHLDFTWNLPPGFGAVGVDGFEPVPLEFAKCIDVGKIGGMGRFWTNRWDFLT
jgi:hypothetical protein